MIKYTLEIQEYERWLVKVKKQHISLQSKLFLSSSVNKLKKKNPK